MEKTAVSRPYVVVSTRESAPGERLFARRLGLQLVDAPVIRYEWIDPDGGAVAQVLSGGISRAWVFTSRRGVQGWARVLASRGHGPENRGSHLQGAEDREVAQKRVQLVKRTAAQTNLPARAQNELFAGGELPAVYVVGERTREAFLDVFPPNEYRPLSLCMPVEQTGHELAELIVSNKVRAAVHFCSRQRRTELALILGKAGVDLVSLQVYSGEPVEQARESVGIDSADAVLFFSPKGVEAFARAYGLAEHDWVAVACGSTTAGAVYNILGKQPLVASGPDAKTMIRRVARHVRDKA